MDDAKVPPKAYAQGAKISNPSFLWLACRRTTATCRLNQPAGPRPETGLAFNPRFAQAPLFQAGCCLQAFWRAVDSGNVLDPLAESCITGRRTAVGVRPQWMWASRIVAVHDRQTRGHSGGITIAGPYYALHF